MSDVPNISRAGGAQAQPAIADDVEWNRDGVHIEKASGLRGDLGLFAVTANGNTRYLTRAEADDLKQACGRDPCFTDDDIYAPATGSGSYAQRAWTQKTRDVDGEPGPKFDVSKTPQAEIDRLKKSTNSSERRLGATIERARVAYADLIAAKGSVVVTTSAGNGGEPVVIVTGPKFDPKEPARVHTHYHGDNATAADGPGSKAGTNARIREAIARNPQAVFVLPESLERSGQTQRSDSASKDTFYKASWTNAKSQAQTTDDALATIGVDKVSKEIVSFHSRGGEALHEIMKDKSGNGLRADRVEMHDSLYGSQYDAAAWAKTDNGKAVARVIFYHGTNNAKAHAPVEQAFGRRFTKVEMGTQAALDDKTNPVHRDADGKTHTRNRDWKDDQGVKHVNRPTVRQFDPDPHYRTTGQFLDAYE